MHNTDKLCISFKSAWALALYCIVNVLMVLPSAWAEHRPELRSGMTLSEVVAVWGAPDAKIELETKRELHALYRDTTLIFSDGKLTLPEPKPAQAVTAEVITKPSGDLAKPRSPVIAHKGRDPLQLEAVFNEVMKSGGNNATSSPSNGRNSSPFGPPPGGIQGIPPPPGMNAPSNSAFAVAPDDE